MAFENNDLKNNGKSKVDIIGTAEGIEHMLMLIVNIDFVYRKKVNHHGTEAEPPSIEKYLRTLMAKKLHSLRLFCKKQIKVNIIFEVSNFI